MIFQDKDRVVFAGDSVTDMDRARPLGEGLFESVGHSYVRIVENMLAAWYPERFIRVTNAGCGGDTSRTLLARWERDVLALNPDWVTICIGINDVWRQFDTPSIPENAVLPDEYERNVEKMIVSLKDKVKGVFVLSPYYMEPNRADKMRARMDEYVEICRALAEKYDCEFVDFQAMYERYFAVRHSTYIAWDRIHPNQIGATLMARELLSHCGFEYGHIGF